MACYHPWTPCIRGHGTAKSGLRQVRWRTNQVTEATNAWV